MAGLLVTWLEDLVAAPLGKEGVEHALGQLDDVDVPGLHGLNTGDVILLLASQGGAVEQVALGASIQQGL